MIASLTGILEQVTEDRVHLQAGPIVYELLVPAADLAALESRIGEEVTFHTLLYFQGDASGGSMEPRLIGFLRLADKRFFEKFITVKGIGPRTALRALTVPVGEIAAAIEQKDARFLVGLNGIGKRTAELMVAELAGKVGAFAGPIAAAIEMKQKTSEDEAAIAYLVSPQMGLRRAEAEALLQRAKQVNPKAQKVDELVPAMLRLHATRG
jgi:Holliday junction DNA helicase RuvA